MNISASAQATRRPLGTNQKTRRVALNERVCKTMEFAQRTPWREATTVCDSVWRVVRCGICIGTKIRAAPRAKNSADRGRKFVNANVHEPNSFKRYSLNNRFVRWR